MRTGLLLIVKLTLLTATFTISAQASIIGFAQTELPLYFTDPTINRDLNFFFATINLSFFI
jgi:hypothetical protein